MAKLAGMDAEFATITSIDLVEQYPGTGSTEFWGISFNFSAFDTQPMIPAEFTHELELMHACWAFFDEVRSRVSPEMRAVWADVLESLQLRGNEHVLDMGCGRGAVMAMVAKLIPRGRVTVVDLWRTEDQSGNRAEIAEANLRAEGVFDRCDQKVGAEILKRALEEPVRQLVPNAGLEGSVVVEQLRREDKPNWGFDVMREQYCDLIHAGIIDPAKVTRSALENATSVAAMILNTEALVTEKPEEKESRGASHNSGHGLLRLVSSSVER